MSFDVFLQRFHHGEVADADSDLVAELLRPYLVETDHGLTELQFSDGTAAIYGLDNRSSGFMLNHASGKEVWSVVAAVAREAELAIIPVGCPAGVSREEMIADLPDGLRDEAVIVGNADDLLSLIESP